MQELHTCRVPAMHAPQARHSAPTRAWPRGVLMSSGRTSRSGTGCTTASPRAGSERVPGTRRSLFTRAGSADRLRASVDTCKDLGRERCDANDGKRQVTVSARMPARPSDRQKPSPQHRLPRPRCALKNWSWAAFAQPDVARPRSGVSSPPPFERARLRSSSRDASNARRLGGHNCRHLAAWLGLAAKCRPAGGWVVAHGDRTRLAGPGCRTHRAGRSPRGRAGGPRQPSSEQAGVQALGSSRRPGTDRLAARRVRPRPTPAARPAPPSADDAGRVRNRVAGLAVPRGTVDGAPRALVQPGGEIGPDRFGSIVTNPPEFGHGLCVSGRVRLAEHAHERPSAGRVACRRPPAASDALTSASRRVADRLRARGRGPGDAQRRWLRRRDGVAAGATVGAR